MIGRNAVAETDVLPSQNMDKAHAVWIDVIKALAIFAVLVQHAATFYIEGNLFQKAHPIWILSNLSRFHVPTFIMITGSLLLGRTISVKYAWAKYIKRIAIAFCVWSSLYTAYNTAFRVGSMGLADILKNAVVDFVSGGTGRMWYLVMLAGLYSITPIISKWFKVATDREQIYLLILLFVVACVLPTITMIPEIETVIGLNAQRISMCFPGIYVFYFLTGHYIAERKARWRKKYSYLLVIVFAAVFLAVYFGGKRQMADFSALPVVVFSVSLFCLAQNIGESMGKVFDRIVNSIADCTFGIYLVHTLFQYLMKLSGLESLLFSLPAIIGVLVYSVVLFLLSWGFTAVLRLTKLGRIIT